MYLSLRGAGWKLHGLYRSSLCNQSTGMAYYNGIYRENPSDYIKGRWKKNESNFPIKMIREIVNAPDDILTSLNLSIDRNASLIANK